MHIVKKMVLWYDYCVWKVMHMKRWNDLFQQEIQKPYYQELMAFLDEEYKTKAIFPPREDLFILFTIEDNLREKINKKIVCLTLFYLILK